MNAYEEIIEFLEKDEKVEAVILENRKNKGKDLVPDSLKGKKLSLNELKDYMDRFGLETLDDVCPFSCYVWTNQKIIFQYSHDCSLRLTSVPRNPTQNTDPQIPGES